MTYIVYLKIQQLVVHNCFNVFGQNTEQNNSELKCFSHIEPVMEFTSTLFTKLGNVTEKNVGYQYQKLKKKLYLQLRYVHAGELWVLGAVLLTV